MDVHSTAASRVMDVRREEVYWHILPPFEVSMHRFKSQGHCRVSESVISCTGCSFGEANLGVSQWVFVCFLLLGCISVVFLVTKISVLGLRKQV